MPSSSPDPEPAAAVARRLEDAGPRVLVDAEVLQLVCGLRPGEAEALIAEFGSLPEALAADLSALGRVVSPGRAARLGLARDLVRRVLETPLRDRPILSGWTVVADYLRAMLSGLPREQFRVLFLDKRNRLIRVHLTVRARSDEGVRLNPKKADLETWRQSFARTLRERGVEAEATPRRSRGVTRKAERGAIRRLRQRHERGRGPAGRVAREKLRQAGLLAFGGTVELTPWERRVAWRQSQIRRIYLAQAKLLQSSLDPADRKLGAEVEAFVRSLRPPDTERLALARALRDANDRARSRDREGVGMKDRG